MSTTRDFVLLHWFVDAVSLCIVLVFSTLLWLLCIILVLAIQP